MSSLTRSELNGNQGEQIQAEQELFNYAVKLCTFSVLPMAVYTAIDLGLFNVISAAGPGAQLSAEELVSQLNATSPLAAAALERILHLLASYSVLTCSSSTSNDGRTIRRYGAAPVCKYFTPNEDGISLASLALMSNDLVISQSWYHLKDTILDCGVAFNRAHGGLTLSEYHATDPRFSKVSSEGMRSHSVIIFKNILGIYTGFRDVNLLVDVCGGTGGSLSAIIAQHPHIRGINFDLPHVISQAPPLPGVEHVGGHVLESVPRGDTLFLKWILHDWNDEDSIKILKNCWKALPDNGKVIVMDYLLPEIPNSEDLTHCILHFDVIMMLVSPKGRVRTEKEYRVLADKSEFLAFNVICNYSNNWIMEFHK